MTVEPPKDDGFETALFQDEKKIDEGVSFVALAITNNWGVPHRTARIAIQRIGDLLEKKEGVKDSMIIAAVRSLVGLDKLR